MVKAVSSAADRSAETAALLAALSNVVGAEHVAVDARSRTLASQDVYRAGETPVAVVSPGSTEETSRVVAAVTSAGLAVVVRGGGTSYTDAVIPTTDACVVLKTDRLTAIREINARDLYATVEAGCTWRDLDEALAEHGLRALFHGPMSGRLSTVGGAMTQGAVTFGSVRHGASINAALSVEVVLADGQVVVTGSAGQANHSPFFRDYGPDLTGLFCADAGALGVKTAVTVRLQPRPACGDSLSFAISDFPSLVNVVREVASQGYATELFGAEASLVRAMAGPANLKRDAGQLMSMLRGAGGPVAALRTALRVGLAGRRFLDNSGFFINFLAEGRDARELRWHLDRIRAAVGESGVEVANTMAEFVRSVPFPEPAVLGPEGRRLLPLHGVVPYSRATALHEAFGDYVASIKDECEQHDVQVYIVYTASGSGGFMYECVLYWKDEWLELHRDTLSNETLSAFAPSPANLDARALVERIRVEVIDMLYAHGCVHYQVGRAYPYMRDRNAPALDVLRSLKNAVDPDNRINPGALGLAS